MKQYEMKGAAGQSGDILEHPTADIPVQPAPHTFIWAEYGEAPPPQLNPIASIASGLRVLYDDIIRQPLPARIGELASFLTAKESWQ